MQEVSQKNCIACLNTKRINQIPICRNGDKERGLTESIVGVTEVYGIDNPRAYQSEQLAFVKEHTMIPQKYIDELEGFERFIFAKLYAGSFSKKLYRLFEYKKN